MTNRDAKVPEPVRAEGPLPKEIMDELRELAAREEEGSPDNWNMDDSYSSGYSDGKRALAIKILAALSRTQGASHG